MKWRSKLLALGLVSALLPVSASNAADHLDGAAVKADASTDVNDVYSWMSTDGSKVYLVMTVFPAADKTTAKFSTAAKYVFHTASRSSFVSTQLTPADVICTFDATQKISCWVGSTEFLTGDASATTGRVSKSGKVKVFAGARKDHFFFNLDGFNKVRTTVKGLNPVPTADANGCFAMSGTNAGGLTMAQTMAVRNQLMQSTAGGAATDFFLPLNALAIVMEVDKTLLNAGGNFLSVWGATHR
jgi:hypothetical protein